MGRALRTSPALPATLVLLLAGANGLLLWDLWAGPDGDPSKLAATGLVGDRDTVLLPTALCAVASGVDAEDLGRVRAHARTASGAYALGRGVDPDTRARLEGLAEAVANRWSSARVFHASALLPLDVARRQLIQDRVRAVESASTLLPETQAATWEQSLYEGWEGAWHAVELEHPAGVELVGAPAPGSEAALLADAPPPPDAAVAARLEAYLAGQQHDENTAMAIRMLVEGYLAACAEIRALERTGALVHAEARARRDEEREIVVVGVRSLVGQPGKLVFVDEVLGLSIEAAIHDSSP